jgi:hypothetical protein
MEGKRYHWPLCPGGNMGGLMQFENGYYPPLDKPPLTDKGMQEMIEKHQLFGTPNLYEMSKPPEPPKVDMTEAIERATAYVEERGLNKPLIHPEPPKEALPTEKPQLPTKTQLSQANKAKLLHWIREQEIAIPNPSSLTNVKLRKILLTTIENRRKG